MLPSTAYLFISHGSRSNRPQLAIAQLAQLVRILITEGQRGEGQRAKHNFSFPPLYPSSGWGSGQELLYTKKVVSAIATHNSSTPLLETATLELGKFPLHQQIRLFAREALAHNYRRLQVLPLFLLPGVHVMADIPQEITIAQQWLGDNMEIQQLPHLGSYPHLGQLLNNQAEIADVEVKILVSHGTRRMGGNQTVEALAQNLGGVAAYWSVAPMLSQQVAHLAGQGYKRIGILPYFLFSGTITDAIAKTVTNLQLEFPHLHLKLGQPLGATPQLAQLIVDLITSS